AHLGKGGVSLDLRGRYLGRRIAGALHFHERDAVIPERDQVWEAHLHPVALERADLLEPCRVIAGEMASVGAVVDEDAREGCPDHGEDLTLDYALCWGRRLHRSACS